MLNEFDWPGWPLKDNPYGKEFDLSARKRMVRGSRFLLDLINKYKKTLGKNFLEIGPFFNPLATPILFSGKKIVYWENDYHVIDFLKKRYPQKMCFPLYCDLNKIDGSSLLKLRGETENLIGKGKGFDCIIASNVFNYIDYKLLLMSLKDIANKGCYLFINNVVDYGLPVFFSKDRPKSNKEI